MRKLTIILLAVFTLLSPVLYSQYTSSPIKISTELANRGGLMFYLHRVEKKQTLFSIAKAYNVNINLILADNPEAKAGIKEGDLIFIRNTAAKAEPASKEKITEAPAPVKQTPSKKETLKHVVRWYETIESIAKLYNVSAESIVSANSLSDNELSARQILQIPLSGNETALKPEPAIGNLPEMNVYKAKKTADAYSVSLVLPFDSKNYETNSGSNNYLDFYLGFLLSVNEMRLSGMNLNLKVIDTKDYANTSLIAQSGRLDGSGLLIGPVFSGEIATLVDYAKEKRIPMISPMDPESEKYVQNNPNFFQVSVPLRDQQEELINSIPEDSNVAIFYEESSPDMELVDLTKDILTKKGIPFSSLSYNLLKGRSVYSSLVEKLNSTKDNAVIVVSNSEAFVSDMLRNLNLINTRSGYKITLYGTPRWRNFENVDINYYHSMNLHLSLQYNVDYSSEEVKTFLSKYRALFGTEPSPYAFQGYDIGLYFLGALYNYGSDFIDFVDEFNSRTLLQSSYKFVRDTRQNGFVNRRSRLIIYRPDFSIESGGFSR